MLYQKPKMEILKFEIQDVICASIVTPDIPEDETGAGGSWAQP